MRAAPIAISSAPAWHGLRNARARRSGLFARANDLADALITFLGSMNGASSAMRDAVAARVAAGS